MACGCLNKIACTPVEQHAEVSALLSGVEGSGHIPRQLRLPASFIDFLQTCLCVLSAATERDNLPAGHRLSKAWQHPYGLDRVQAHTGSAAQQPVLGRMSTPRG